MEIDWNGIARSRRLISGGQDESNILALVTDDPVTEDQLNALIPDEDGEFPAEGGWFAGPGGWLLSIEPSEPAKPHIEALVRSLEYAGITGTLTGAKPYRRPAWARPIEVMPSWTVVFSHRPRPEWDRSPGWWSDATLLEPVIDHAVDWATADGGQLVVNINLKPGFPFTPEAGKQALRNQAKARRVSSVTGYDKQKQLIRHARVSAPGYVELILHPARAEWAADIDRLRATALTAPLDKLTSATISNHGWADFDSAEQTHFNGFDYSGHPEIWDEYILNPCGIQIITNKHLARANNLDDWNTKQLDDHHYLVQAKDLGPWYSQPLSYYDEPDPEVTTKARADFGEMLFTHATAQHLGITSQR